MKQVRQGIFETNSSSTHNLTISGRRNYDFSSLETNIEPETVLRPHFGEFGWGYETLNTPQDKLSYLLTYVTNTEDTYPNAEKFKKTIEVALGQYGVRVVWPEVEEESEGNWQPTGYIDHQSVDFARELFQEVMSSKKQIIGFLFGPDVEVVIDNDNH